MALRPLVCFVLAVAVWLAAAAVPAAAQTVAQAPADGSAAPVKTRPVIGLVLSGGGARGLAHVGVLKVLERERIPVDLVVGTSMGAIIGGLYASGMRAADLERELGAVRWDELFAPRVDRQQLSQRRKEQDAEISAVLELGYRDGGLRTPQSAVSSRGLESLLRRYTLPVRAATDFSQLPIPFRAIATDMETGAEIEISRGDLATALRSSMSVPGVFAPTERDGRVLGDGGLVNNLPVDVARRMGADIVIAVNVGTPLSGRETLGSLIGLTAQMINILTEQNVQRSLATLKPTDLLITPALGELTSGDFDRTADFIRAGEAAGNVVTGRLWPLAADEPRYAEWGRRHVPPPRVPVKIAAVEFEGSAVTNPQRFAAQLETQPGQPFSANKAERDARRLAASGDYLRADYRLVEGGSAGDTIVFDLEDKPWGPDFLRAGLNLSTNFAGQSNFNLKLSHERHWLTPNGTEWRNRVNLGEAPMVSSELYHPLKWSTKFSDDWFLSTFAMAERRPVYIYDELGDQTATFIRLGTRVGVDLGQPWGDLGELRFGLQLNTQRTAPRIIDARYNGPRDIESTQEFGPRARVVIDQLDYALFPQSGYRLEAEASIGHRYGAEREPFMRVQSNAMYVRSFGRHTVSAFGVASISDEGGSTLVGRYTLGGFHQLSGYETGQLSGNHLLFGRLTWYMRLSPQGTLSRGFFFGATLEAGNTWMQRSQVSLSDLRTGASVFVGADTGVGPMYLGLTTAPRGSTGIVFSIGQP